MDFMDLSSEIKETDILQLAHSFHITWKIKLVNFVEL